jgi:hypothetical protein
VPAQILSIGYGAIQVCCRVTGHAGRNSLPDAVSVFCVLSASPARPPWRRALWWGRPFFVCKLQHSSQLILPCLPMQARTFWRAGRRVPLQRSPCTLSMFCAPALLRAGTLPYVFARRCARCLCLPEGFPLTRWTVVQGRGAMLRMMRHMVQRSGWQSLYLGASFLVPVATSASLLKSSVGTGLTPSLLQIVPYVGLQFGFFHLIKRHLAVHVAHRFPKTEILVNGCAFSLFFRLFVSQ